VRYPEAKAEIVQRGAFFDISGWEKPRRDGMPPWVRHLALSDDSPETLAAWKVRLELHGLQVTDPVDHDGGVVVDLFQGSERGHARAHLPGACAERRGCSARDRDGGAVDGGKIVDGVTRLVLAIPAYPHGWPTTRIGRPRARERFRAGRLVAEEGEVR